MIDQLLINAIGDALAIELPGVYIGRQHTHDDITLPALLLSIEGEAVVGGNIYRGTLTAMAVSASADTTSTAHAEFAKNADAAIRALSISEPPDVALYGVVATGTSAEVDQNQFRTGLTYIVGYGPTA
jgi:hypothetical protein